MDSPFEFWRPVRRHPGYEASSLGRVRSVPRTLRDGRQHGGQILAAAPDKDGYLRVKLGRKPVPVHVAVLLAFAGPPEGRHLNGDHLDNTPGNLAWGSHLDNERDKSWDGNRSGYPPVRLRTQSVTSGTQAVMGGPVTLAQAVQLGILNCTVGAARLARHRERETGFPAAVSQLGAAHLYDRAGLAAWSQARRPLAS